MGAETFTIDGVDVYAEYIAPAADADGMVLVTEEVRKALSNMIAILHDAANEEAYAESAGDYAYQEWEEFCYIGQNYPAMDFSEVGIFALSDTELCYAIESPLEGFYLKYALPDVLVNEELYLACEKMDGDVYSNTYGTSVDTWMSYGPYKLVNYQMDKEIALTKNEHYFENGQYGTAQCRDYDSSAFRRSTGPGYGYQDSVCGRGCYQTADVPERSVGFLWIDSGGYGGVFHQ